MRDLIDFNLQAANLGGCGISDWPTLTPVAASQFSRSLVRLKPLTGIKFQSRVVVSLNEVLLRRTFLAMAQREALRATGGEIERLALVWLSWTDAQALAKMTGRELETLACQGDQLLEFVGPTRPDQCHADISYRHALWCPDFPNGKEVVEHVGRTYGVARLRVIALAESLIEHGASTPEVEYFTSLNEKVIRELTRQIRGKCTRGPVQYPGVTTLVGSAKKIEPRLVAKATIFASAVQVLKQLHPSATEGEAFTAAVRLTRKEAEHHAWSWSSDDIHRCFQTYRLLSHGELVLGRCACGDLQLKPGWYHLDKPCLGCRRENHFEKLREVSHLGGRRKQQNLCMPAC